MYNVKNISNKPQNIDPIIESFLTDLSNAIPNLQIESLKKVLSDDVNKEQKRLLASTNFLDKVTGDLPIVTPYDKLKTEPKLLPQKLVVNGFLHRYYNLWILNHQARIKALKELIYKGYYPPPNKNIPVIENATNHNTALDFDDLGFIVDEEFPHIKLNVSKIARIILSTGPYSYIANNLVALPYILSSMPDISSSLSVATHALSGGLAFIPFDSIWNKFENQKIAALRAWEIIKNDSIINSSPDKNFLLNHYRRLIGITLKAVPKSVETLIEYIHLGFTTFRIYDARSKETILETIKKAREILANHEFDKIRDKITIFAGQISGVEIGDKNQALRIQKSGANAVICGIGGGGICSTPNEAAIHTANINIGYAALKSGLKIPLIFDGGVGSRLPIVLAMGGAGVLKSSALAGGTIEQPPYMWYHTLSDGRYAKNMSGEAAPRTKYLGGKLDFLNRPLFVEGADEYCTLNDNAPSITDNTWYLLQSLATALIFARVKNIEELQMHPNPLIWLATDNAHKRAAVHHNHKI